MKYETFGDSTCVEEWNVNFANKFENIRLTRKKKKQSLHKLCKIKNEKAGKMKMALKEWYNLILWVFKGIKMEIYANKWRGG